MQENCTVSSKAEVRLMTATSGKKRRKYEPEVWN